MVPSVVIIVVNSLLVVDGVNEDVALGVVGEVLEALDVLDLVVEAGGEHERLVGVLSAVAQLELVAVQFHWLFLRYFVILTF